MIHEMYKRFIMHGYFEAILKYLVDRSNSFTNIIWDCYNWYLDSHKTLLVLAKYASSGPFY